MALGGVRAVNDAVTTALLNAGILGPILLSVAWYVLRLETRLRETQGELREVSEKRVADAQAVTTTVLALADRMNEDSQENSTSLQKMAQSIDTLVDEIRRTRSGRA